MIKFKYVGDDPEHQLAQVGKLVPGQEFSVSEKMAALLEKHGAESYVRVSEPAIVDGSKNNGQTLTAPVEPVPVGESTKPNGGNKKGVQPKTPPVSESQAV